MGAPTDRSSGVCGRSGLTSNFESSTGASWGRARVLKIHFEAFAGLRAETSRTEFHRLGRALAALNRKVAGGEVVRCTQALPTAVVEVGLEQARADLPTVIELQGFAFRVAATGPKADPWAVVDLRSAWDVRDLSLVEYSVALD